jgi:hypothetical protein
MKQEVFIAELLNEVQKGLADAQAELQGARFPALESVTLTLQTEVVRRGEAGITILIFSFGRKWEKERAQEMTLTLRPPEAAPPTAARVRPSVSAELVAAIVAAARGVKEAGDRQPPLHLARFEATFSFVVKTDTRGGLPFEIVPVSAELQGDLTRTARHSITITFSGGPP